MLGFANGFTTEYMMVYRIRAIFNEDVASKLMMP
jgi:hypothetical protein